MQKIMESYEMEDEEVKAGFGLCEGCRTVKSERDMIFLNFDITHRFGIRSGFVGVRKLVCGDNPDCQNEACYQVSTYPYGITKEPRVTTR